MKWLLLCLAIVGCAKAGKENSIIGGINDAGADRRGDAGDFPEPDASLIDAPPQQITLTQTTSNTITDFNTFSCRDGAGVSAQNTYYRVFTLSDDNITTMLHVTQIAFGIEFAAAGPAATKQPAHVQIGTYGAAPTGIMLDPAQIRMISSADIQIPDGAGTQMAVPITGDVAPGTRLIVMLDVPDGATAQSEFIIGSNAQGERTPGYTSAPGCAYTSPTTMKSIATTIGRGDADLLLSVTGTH
jgi:hypothetical protein